MTIPFDPSRSAALPSGRWDELATTDFDRVDPLRTVAVLPVAAVEQHGPHLPLATDALINEGLLDRAMRRLPHGASVLRLPALPLGDSLEHSDFAGTLSIDLEPLLGQWLSVGRSVARAGVRKLVILNTHGGQKAHVDLVALRLRQAHGMRVVRANSFSWGVPPGLFEVDELAHGLHGGAVETSLILHLRPNLVRRDAIADFRSFGAELAGRGGVVGAEKPVGIAWMSQDLNPQGACGDATAATADKGREVMDHLVDRLLQVLAETAALPPLEAGAA